jgi:hypothetical protein
LISKYLYFPIAYPSDQTPFQNITTIQDGTLDTRCADPSLASMNSLYGKYTTLSTWALKKLPSSCIRQACLPSRAKLNNSMSRKPRPPKNFGSTMSSQATQHVFLFPSLLPHQKLRRRPLMCWHRPLGSLKHDIEYVGIACATDLIHISFPSTDKQSPSQP